MQLNLHNVLSITADQPKSRELDDIGRRYLVRELTIRMRDSSGEHVVSIVLFSADLDKKTKDGKTPSLLLESEERMTEPAPAPAPVSIDPGDGQPF